MKDNLPANELRNAKNRLEKDIHDLVEKFCQEQGISYSDIYGIQIKSTTANCKDYIDIKVKINI
jgi:hypothetical protein